MEGSVIYTSKHIASPIPEQRKQHRYEGSVIYTSKHIASPIPEQPPQKTSL